MAAQRMMLKLVEARSEAGDVRSFLFDPCSYKPDYKPGQHITMALDIKDCDERCNVRPFTLSSSPTERFLMVSTRISQSAFKRTLNSVPIGTEVRVTGPSGSFTLQEDYSLQAVMLAGGIGITPFRSMIRFATDRQLPLKIILLYSNRAPKTITFREELAGLEAQNPNLTVINTVTDEDGSNKVWAGETGRINADMIKRHVAGLDNAIFYACGPPAMVDSMLAALSGLGIPNDRIRLERFEGY
ncbi:FAD-dependent oxidoreductase [Candidatus Woesearchaeota archaeon]|nr:FAD-dependent oxidoreductase [Candidatus Woesearchaeota archaeon]